MCARECIKINIITALVIQRGVRERERGGGGEGEGERVGGGRACTLHTCMYTTDNLEACYHNTVVHVMVLPNMDFGTINRL